MLSVISRFGVDDVTRAAPRMASMPPHPRRRQESRGSPDQFVVLEVTGRCGPVRSGAHVADAPVGATAGDRVSRDGGRPLPDLTSRTESPDAVIIQPGTIAPGRARGAGPLRREGPAKLTGAAKYADDLVFPGAWFGATIRSTDAHARFVALDLDPAFDWSTVVVVTAADIPGDNIVSSIKEDQPILVPVGGEIRHHAEPLALLAAPDRATLRAARAAVHPRTEPLPAVFDPLELGPRVRRVRAGQPATRMPRSPPPT